MPIPITIPRQGWSMEEATFSAWLKKPGENVRPGDALFAIETDKATQEIESLDAGILHLSPNAPRSGDAVRVGQRIAFLLAPGEALPVTDAPEKRDGPVIPQPGPKVPAASQGAQPGSHRRLGSPPSTPRARRVAARLGIDWRTVHGSGNGGRVRERDIPSNAPSSLSPRRRVIAGRMLSSQQKTAAVTLHTTADATGLVQLRAEFKSRTTGGPIPGYNDLLVKLTSAALEAHPMLNSRWDGDQLRASREIHMGVAVDTEAGLLVPVIRDSANLSLDDIALRSRDLTERARNGRLADHEGRDGTFTITSLGPFGIDAFTPIINYPECAILGVGRIRKQPVVTAGTLAIRDVITLSLTFDHRAFDGAPAARFLQCVVGLIECPLPTLFKNNPPS